MSGGVASLLGQGPTVEFHWPDDFSAVVVPGKHHVTWATASAVTVGLIDKWTDVAYDVFTV